MARCTYCGKPAGLLRKDHPQCRERYENAINRIPAFFSKILNNPLDAQRFSQLLVGVAETSHIPPDIFKSINLAGLNNIIDEILQQRLITLEEEQRIFELKDALNIGATEFSGMEDKLIKAAILRDLSEHKSSQHIEIVGPMPIDLGPNETVFWIFNQVKCFQPQPADKATGITLPLEDFFGGQSQADQTLSAFFPRTDLSANYTLPDTSLDDGTGDLVITNYNLYFLSKGKWRLIPISEIGALNLYAEGIKVGRAASDNGGRIFLLKDPWFAANLIAMGIMSTRSNASIDH